MSSLVRYLTHPQVAIDAAVAVPRWSLSEVGLARVRRFCGTPLLARTRTVISSAENKALQTAQPIAAALDLEVTIRPDMHENNRSATGFLPPAQFESFADAFFASPHVSVHGWERAIDAQARIVAQTRAALAAAPDGEVLLVGHGAVGTLLFCYLAGLPISRVHDQPAGGGNLFAFDRVQGSIRHTWRALEDLEPGPGADRLRVSD